MKVMLAA